MEKNKRKVLIVDDDNDLRTVIGDKLGAVGFDVADAANGEEGLKKALEWHPDVILLDVLMPRMNGWEVLEKLRKDSWGEKANVIMLTVLENMDDVAHAVAKGSYEYLLKTNYNLEEVVKRVENSLRMKT